MLEGDAVIDPIGDRHVGVRLESGGIVLQPGQPSGAVHPDAPEKADLAHRGRDVGRQAGAGGQHEEHVLGRGVEPRGDVDDGAHEAGAEDRPAQRVPHG